jgi:hypothetical protein
LLLSLGKCIILALKIIIGHKCSSFKHSPCTEGERTGTRFPLNKPNMSS